MALNIETVGAVVPGANIAVFFARDIPGAIRAATRDVANKPTVILITWGAPEGTWTAGSLTNLKTKSSGRVEPESQSLQPLAISGPKMAAAPISQSTRPPRARLCWRLAALAR